MKFPEWVLKQPGHTQARTRLGYMIKMAAVQCTGTASMTSFAAHVGVDRTLLHRYIAQGSFTESAAQKISLGVGGILRASDLTQPLSINVE
jgi:hypothetical protein